MVLAMELALKLVVLALDDLDMEARVIIAVLEDTVCGLAPGVCVCVCRRTRCRGQDHTRSQDNYFRIHTRGGIIRRVITFHS